MVKESLQAQTGTVPKIMKEALMVPVNKRDKDKTKSYSYRRV